MNRRMNGCNGERTSERTSAMHNRSKCLSHTYTIGIFHFFEKSQISQLKFVRVAHLKTIWFMGPWVAVRPLWQTFLFRIVHLKCM